MDYYAAMTTNQMCDWLQACFIKLLSNVSVICYNSYFSY